MGRYWSMKRAGLIAKPKPWDSLGVTLSATQEGLKPHVAWTYGGVPPSSPISISVFHLPAWTFIEYSGTLQISQQNWTGVVGLQVGEQYCAIVTRPGLPNVTSNSIWPD